MKHIAISFAFLFLTVLGYGSDTIQSEDLELTDEQYMLLYQNYTDSIEQTLNYQTGTIELKDGIAIIVVPEGFKYLGTEESEMVLTQVWGNPPSSEGNKSLGMLFPKDGGIGPNGSYAIDITYADEGFIDDDDAKDLDYDDVLEGMQSDTEASNEYRVSEGYEPIELVGWASPPFYDAVSKKLHWAQELKFGDSEENTLNYNIRVLGRRGYLVLNAIGTMDELKHVQRDIDVVLSSVNFKDGHKYSDFDPKMDKVAAYGIGGLIAGKVLAKAGILAKLGIVFAKFGKFLIIGLIAFGAGFKKLFRGKSKEPQRTTYSNRDDSEVA